MLIDVVTIFPEMFTGPMNAGILGRAQESGRLSIRVHDLRCDAEGRHRVTDEPPYGGGPGMVMKPEPFFRAVDRCRAQSPDSKRPRVILMTPQGRRLTHARCEEFARENQLIVLCPRYEGVDERVRQLLATDEISIGDFVVSGGEIPAMALIDAVSRLIPGVVGEPESVVHDSFSKGMLEGPHYTRPREFRGFRVPDILLSGNHEAIDAWRRRQSERRTEQRRPDLRPHRRTRLNGNSGFILK